MWIFWPLDSASRLLDKRKISSTIGLLLVAKTDGQLEQPWAVGPQNGPYRRGIQRFRHQGRALQLVVAKLPHLCVADDDDGVVAP